MNSADQLAVAAEPKFAAFVAIDWADQQSCWRLQEAGGARSEAGTMENRPEAVERWAAELDVRFAGKPVAVAIEPSRGRVVYQLSKFPHLVIYPVPPKMAAQFRAALHPSGAKSDAGDTEVLLKVLVSHRDGLRRLAADTPETRLLQMLVEQRRMLVNEKTRCSNRLTDALKMYFPQVLDWIDDIDSEMGGDFLTQWPTLEKVQRVHPGTLKKFFTAHNCRSEEKIRQRTAQIYEAVPATRDPAIQEAYALLVSSLVALLAPLRQGIGRLDERIAQLTAAHPEREVFAGLPGAGPVLLPRLIAAFGTQRERYRSAAEVQNFSGIAPVTVQSGNSRWVHWRWACPKFLRQTFHEFAAHSLQSCPWARALYEAERAQGKRHHAAVRKVAYKWIRILFRCWRTHQPYDEELYLRQLEKHNSLFAVRSVKTGKASQSDRTTKAAARGSQPSTQYGWQPVAGFSKFVEVTS